MGHGVISFAKNRLKHWGPIKDDLVNFNTYPDPNRLHLENHGKLSVCGSSVVGGYLVPTAANLGSAQFSSADVIIKLKFVYNRKAAASLSRPTA